MRKIKASSSYLKNQTRRNLAKASFCFLIIFAGLTAVAFRVLSTLQVGLLEQAGLILLVVPLIGFYFYLRKYRIYSGGLQGEKQVVKLLGSTLSDDYYLINDLYLKDGAGDIDHVVLAPSGVFVLETKNWTGIINCVGNQWQRAGKRNFNASPSRQVKRNVAKIKQILDNAPHLRSLGVWVEGIVVITNKHATLQLNNPTVPVLKLLQLPNYLTNHGSQRRFSREQLEAIGREIAKQKA
ncbi:MAG: NERD domain-containing protein [Candidatus Bathyarchaeota archaeon]|nr:NERD domain-containing protein [Candidatus Bathyarchaeota archaeon]